MTEATLNLQLRQAQTSEQLYRRIGDEVGAMQARIRQREIEIQIMQARNCAAVIEADLAVAAVNAEREALALAGPIEAAKRLELEARLRNAEAKRLEAELGAESVRQIRDEIQALREYNDVPERAPRRRTDVQQPDRDQIDGGSGFGSGSGGGSADALISVQDAFDIQSKLNSGKLTAGDLEQAKAAQKQAQDASGWLDSMQGSSAGSVSTSARTSADALLRSTTEALRRIESMAAEEKRKERLAANQAQQRSVTPVNISILGKPQKPVNVTGSDDADALAGILQQLEDAKARYSV